MDLGLKQRPQDVISSRYDWNSEFPGVINFGVESLNSGGRRLEVTPTYRFTEKDFVHGNIKCFYPWGLNSKEHIIAKDFKINNNLA